MLTRSTIFDTAMKSPVRRIIGKVELWQVNTANSFILSKRFYEDDYIKSIKIERIADESKFFGFGVAQKLNVKLRDVDRILDFTPKASNGKRYALKVYIGVPRSGDTEEYVGSPYFFITETHRDENTNELSITAYDTLYFTSIPISSIGAIEGSMTYLTYINRIRTAVHTLTGATHHTSPRFINCSETEDFAAHAFPKGGNYEGSETCREVLDDIAEATHTVYYIDHENHICFRRPDRDGDPVYTITRSDYITLDSSTNRRLGVVMHATELGDNISSSTSESGTTQIMRDNGFYTLLTAEELAAALDKTITNLGGLTVNQFDCSWRGHPALEPGDKIALVTKDGATVESFLYSDSITYDGTLDQKSEWHYTADETELNSAPTTLGDALKQVYAKVDKVNKQISLVVGEEINKQLGDGALNGFVENVVDEKIASIQIDTDSIKAEVMQSTHEMVEGTLSGVNDQLTTLQERVSMTMNKDQVEILIEDAITNGSAQAVETSTGFKFNEEGLTISKTGTQMKTNIDEDGMSITRSNEEVLTADNTGVRAENLHARTYLIVGANSRFEDYDNGKRTGCFWIGE